MSSTCRRIKLIGNDLHNECENWKKEQLMLWHWSPEVTSRGWNDRQLPIDMANGKHKCHILHVSDSKPWVGTYWILADLIGVAIGNETELPFQLASCYFSQTACQDLFCDRHSLTISCAKTWFETKWKRTKQVVNIQVFLGLHWYHPCYHPREGNLRSNNKWFIKRSFAGTKSRGS